MTRCGAEGRMSYATGPSVASLVLMALGCGCYLGWQLVDISPTLFPEPGDGVRWLLDAWSYVATALLLAALAGCALLARRAPLLPRTWLVGLAALGPFVGTALLYASGWLAEPVVTLGVVAGRLLYAASAGFVVLWGEALCRVRDGRALACVAGAYSTAFAICLLVAYLDAGAALLFRTVLPLLSGGSLLAVRGELLASYGSVCAGSESLAMQPMGHSGAVGGDVFTTNVDEVVEHTGVPACAELTTVGVAARESRSVREALPVRVFVGIGVLGAIFIATNHLSETKTDVSTELYTLVSGICVSLMMLGVAFVAQRRRRRANFALIYRLVTPLVIGCLLLTLVLQGGYQRYEALAIGLAWAFFRVLTWTLWAHVGARDAARGACAFALGQICLTLGSTLGELLCSAVNLPSVPLVAAAAVIIFAAVVTSTLVMDEGSLSRLFAPRAGEGAGEFVGASRRDAEGTASSAGATTVAQAGGATAGVSVCPPLGWGRPATAGVRMGAPTGSSAYADLTLDAFSRAVATLGLSERERHISQLVLCGEDNASICDQLCITESTLRTHLRNIYAKTDVHSRVELIQLLATLVHPV